MLHVEVHIPHASQIELFLLITVAIPINSDYQCIMHAGHVLLLMQVASACKERRNVLMPESKY